MEAMKNNRRNRKKVKMFMKHKMLSLYKAFVESIEHPSIHDDKLIEVIVFPFERVIQPVIGISTEPISYNELKEKIKSMRDERQQEKSKED